MRRVLGANLTLGGNAVRTLLVVVVIAVAVAAPLLVTRGSTQPPSAVSTNPLNWSLPRLDSPGTVELAGFRGHPLVLDFFASWCGDCKTELPAFADVSRRLGGRVAFAGVNSEETGDGLAMATSTGVRSWPLARDVGGRELSGLRDALEPTPGMPITAFYDARGHLQRVRLGALSGDDLTAEIDQLFHLRPA